MADTHHIAKTMKLVGDREQPATLWCGQEPKPFDFAYVSTEHAILDNGHANACKRCLEAIGDAIREYQIRRFGFSVARGGNG